MAKVLILYYSAYGHIETMAGAVAEGARSAGAQVTVKRVPELIPVEVAKAAHMKLDQAAPIATVDELASYDAIIVDTDAPDCGIGLVRDLRAQPATYKTPIVALSADGGFEKSGSGGAHANVTEWVHKPVDADRLAQILERSIVSRGDNRPSILHVDDDPDMLEIVAQTLDSTASVTSVDSVESARCALLVHNFDLAILDIGLGAASGLDLLPDLHGRQAPIPVIIFSAHVANLKDNPQIRANLNKASTASLRDLVSAVHDRLTLQSAPVARETA